MGAKVSKKRKIFVQKPLQRIPKFEQTRLKDTFEQWQNQDKVMPLSTFLKECMNSQIPEQIGLKLYRLFSTEKIVKPSGQQRRDHQVIKPDNNTYMNYDDFMTYYAVMRSPKDRELAVICFEVTCDLQKLKYDSDYHNMNPESVKSIILQDLTVYTQTFGYDKENVSAFYRLTGLSNMSPIKLQDFVTAWSIISTIPMFQWIHSIASNNVDHVQNIDDDGKSGIDRRLTKIHVELSLSQSISSGKLTEEETEQICKFFEEEVQGADATQIVSLFTLMYRHVKNKKLFSYLRKYSCNVQGGVTLEFLTNLVSWFIKDQGIIVDLKQLFSIFTNNQEYMNKKQQKDFLESFNLRLGLLGVHQQLSREEFVVLLKDEKSFGDEEIESIKQARFMIKAMIALPVDEHLEQKDVILAALDGQRNLEAYISENMLDERTFYVIEQEFWDKWCHSIGFHDQSLSFALKDMPKETIQNCTLLEQFHQFRMKEYVTYKNEYIIVPKYVYKPLQFWYEIDQVITRKVIIYNTTEPQVPSNSRSRAKAPFHSSSGFQSASLLQVQPSSGAQGVNQFVKRIANTIYELELEPKLVYISTIDEKGQKPYQKQLINTSYRVDTAFINKNFKSRDNLPFKEHEFSRKVTLQEILEQAAAKQEKSSKNSRLIINDQPIGRNQLAQTLEDFQIEHGQMIYIEFANESNNQWPSEKIPKPLLRSQSSGTNFGQKNKTSGLVNLGNTCYLNAAIQCLVNNSLVYNYFVESQKYQQQRNLKSKFAHNGDLVDTFANLVQQMWQSETPSVIPKEFKDLVSTISDQFEGYDQQDSQEFLCFLLDGLHEELNLRQEKPYIPNPESDNRKTVELGLESWSNSLRREWSFILFMFYGQLKSTLTCKNCRTQSITFDVFSNIPLPLPEPASRIINVIIYRLPNRIKDILSGNVNNKNATEFSDTNSEMSSRVHSARSGQFGRAQQSHRRLTEKINYMTNDQPIRVSMEVRSDCRMSDVKKRILQFRELNICIPKQTNICFYMNNQNGESIDALVHPDIIISQSFQLTSEIQCIEVLTAHGKKTIKEFYLANEDYLQNNPNALLSSLVSVHSIKHEQEGEQYRQQYKEKVSKRKRMQQSLDIYNIFNSTGSLLMPQKSRFPQEIVCTQPSIYVVVYHRRFIRKEHYFLTQNSPQLLGSPILLELSVQSSGKRIYDEIWALAHKMLQDDSPLHKKTNRWWEKQDLKKKLKTSKALSEIKDTFQPYVVKTVDRSGLNCGECHWSSKCSGCVVIPNEQIYGNMLNCPTFAIEWHSKLIEECYNPKANEIIQHQSVQDLKDTVVVHQSLNLEDCFAKFNKVENLDKEMNCKKCASDQLHTKQIDIFQPPPILIIQLKRFKVVGNIEAKMTHVIEFPIFNLDLSHFMTDKNFLNDLGISSNYDLSGLVLHFGSIDYGHYISVVKNHFDNKWYKYDDQQRQEIQEDIINKESAYILFYVRRDLQRKQINDVFPSLVSHFPGKPVTTTDGQEGFIMPNPNEKNSSNKLMVKLKDEQQPKLIDLKQIAQEKDKDELVYSKKELDQIKQQKLDQKKRLSNANNEMSDGDNGGPQQIVKTTAICGCFSKKATSKHNMVLTNDQMMARGKVDQQPPINVDVQESESQSEVQESPVHLYQQTGQISPHNNQENDDQETDGNHFQEQTPIKLNNSSNESLEIIQNSQQKMQVADGEDLAQADEDNSLRNSIVIPDTAKRHTLLVPKLNNQHHDSIVHDSATRHSLISQSQYQQQHNQKLKQGHRQNIEF